MLSNLHLAFDEYSFSSTFSRTEKIYDAEIAEDGIENQRELQFVTESQLAVEIKNLISKYVSQPTISNNKTGTIEFRVTFFDFQEKHALKAISTLSFGILNLAGLPAGGGKHTVELQAVIYNDKGKPLKTYTGFGTDSYLTGIYYHSMNQKRPSLIKSIKSAIEAIDQQLYHEREQLTDIISANR